MIKLFRKTGFDLMEKNIDDYGLDFEDYNKLKEEIMKKQK